MSVVEPVEVGFVGWIDFGALQAEGWLELLALTRYAVEAVVRHLTAASDID